MKLEPVFTNASNHLKYKMVVSDFDHTITTSRDTVTENTRAAIRRYRQAGGIFLLNTGRSYLSTVPRLEDVYGNDSINFPVGCLQGCMIYSPSGEVISSKSLDRAELLRILRENEERGLFMQLYSGNDLYADRTCEFAKGYAKMTRTTQTFVGTISKFVESNNITATKLLVITKPAEVKSLFTAYDNDKSFKSTKFVMSTDYFFEAIPQSGGKDVALKFFSKMYNIPVSKIAAVGDNNNDISMIEEAGLGVAVGNAVDTLKKTADLIIDTNDNEGLAKFLDELTASSLV